MTNAAVTTAQATLNIIIVDISHLSSVEPAPRLDGPVAIAHQYPGALTPAIICLMPLPVCKYFVSPGRWPFR